MPICGKMVGKVINSKLLTLKKYLKLNEERKGVLENKLESGTIYGEN